MAKLSYEKSGVSIAGGDAWVETIKSLLSKAPKDNSCVGGVGGFAGLYRIGNGQCLAACCDGVGTKLELGKATGLYRGLGQDLVAMNVNDLVTVGARPLFFLDYAACGRLDESILSEIVQGVISACEESLCTLLGGETAEMPGVYGPDGFDLAGFSVGIVDENKIIDGSEIQEGDLLIGLPSSGVHSNGYSLVRSALGKEGINISLDSVPQGWDKTVGETVMTPTKLYVKAALAAAATGKVRGMAHITGGGMYGNIIRIIPKHLDIAIDFGSWKRQAVFDLIQSAGIDEDEMRRVFNLGIGFVFAASPDDLDDIKRAAASCREDALVIGEVVKCEPRA